jgi:hypothetical protein
MVNYRNWPSRLHTSSMLECIKNHDAIPSNRDCRIASDTVLPIAHPEATRTVA